MKEEMRGSRVFAVLATGLMLSGSVGCTQNSQNKGGVAADNLVRSGDPKTSRVIGDSYSVLGQEAFRSQIIAGQIHPMDSVSAAKILDSLIGNDISISSRSLGNANRLRSVLSGASSNSLIFGLPFNLLKKPLVFGSVITQVSDQNSEGLGGLKMGDIPPFQVQFMTRKADDGTYQLSVINCDTDCSKVSNPESLLDIPVTGVDSQKKLMYLDLASLGSGLDLTETRKGDPVLAQFQSKSNETVRFDYSEGTLVFDVETHLIDVNAKLTDSNAQETVITNRWYFKLESPFNPSFVSRKATPGVGFFMTQKSADPLIQRWDFDLRDSDAGIHYYVKHVPQEYQDAFAGAFDEWNYKLLPILGKRVFSYEFIPEGDPRNDLLVAGDVRYNILEWDLLNKAEYGGLGPSLANQYSGEIFHGNVLIQGPTIVDLYKKWFHANETAHDLREVGRSHEAEAILTSATRELKSKIHKLYFRKFQMRLGGFQVRIRAQDPALEDPIMSKDGFDPVPEGYTYEHYMTGYFHDMVTHELGHNLGLRHNFRGNLGASPGRLVEGGVSRSIMEYLGRGYRYLDHVGDYDLMAIFYGYLGVQPSHTDWYCTDEDSADLKDPSKSAECSPNDATEDPFSFFQGQLAHATDLLLARGQSSAPDWNVNDLEDQLRLTLVGLGSYAVSAAQTSSGWTNFFDKEGRPRKASEVKSYVLNALKASLCDATIEREIETKSTVEARTKAQANITDLRAKVLQILNSVYSSDELTCLAVNDVLL